MITAMAQTGDRVSDLANTHYHLMRVNTDVEAPYSNVPLFSFRTDTSKTRKGEQPQP
jgi:hypothetical protein